MVVEERVIIRKIQYIGKILSILLVAFMVLVTLPVGATSDSNPPDVSKIFSPPSTPAKVSFLTPKEQAWLKKHPHLLYSSDSARPPFEFLNSDRQYQGMIPDLIHLIEKNLHYQFQSESSKNWEDTLEKLKKHKIAMIPGLAKTPQRAQYMAFTQPVYSFPIVMVIRDDRGFIGDLRELKSEKVGVVKGYAAYDYLLINHPNLNLVFLDSLQQGLLSLSNGDLDVLVSNIPSVSYLVKKLGISNLKVTSVTPYKFDLRIGVDPKYPILLSILKKAIGQVSRASKDRLYNRWISKEFKTTVDYVVIRRVLLVATVVVFIFLYWNRKLAKEVAERIKSENALRKSEDQLRKSKLNAEILAQKTVAANRAKSAFLANMSHEIRTPMNSVMGYTELLSRAIDDPHQRSYIESIQTGSKALLTLINDILDLSKIEAGKMQIEYSPVHFRELLHEVEQIFAEKIESKMLKFDIAVAENLPPTEMLDQTRLRQVLFNLVGNAIKFTHKGGIIVRAFKGHQQGDAGHFDLVFEVEDTGIGIAEDQLENIFVAFEQQQGQSMQRYGGTGLGLTISKKLVEMMGGTLSLESFPGKGSCFRVMLKNVGEVKETESTKIISPLKTTEETAFLQIKLKPAKILVVDDRQENRQLIIELLSDQPLKFRVAENGAMAVIVASQWHPDLILMDLRMPVLNGFDALDRIRKRIELKSVPVIAVTAAAMRKDEKKIRQSGFNGYIKKPVLYIELLNKMAQHLEFDKVHHVAELSGKPVQEVKHNLNHKIIEQLESLSGERGYPVNGSADMAMSRQFVAQLYPLIAGSSDPEWQNYVTALTSAIEGFDLDKIQQLLNEYPSRVEQSKLQA